MEIWNEEEVDNMLQIDSESGRDRIQKLFRYAQVGRCVNGVMHDINNFLGAMMDYAELVSIEDNISEDGRRMLGEIVDASSKCSKLLNNLTAIARDQKISVGMVAVHIVVEQALAIRAYAMRIEHITHPSRRNCTMI